MNTITLLKKLDASGFTQKQSETIIEAIEDWASTPNDLQKVESNLRSEIYQAKFDLIKWIVGGIVTNGIIATLLHFASQ